jgi:hypothetical protein
MGGEILKISISETTGPIGTKLCLNSPWVIPFRAKRGRGCILFPIHGKISKKFMGSTITF